MKLHNIKKRRNNAGKRSRKRVKRIRRNLFPIEPLARECCRIKIMGTNYYEDVPLSVIETSPFLTRLCEESTNNRIEVQAHNDGFALMRQVLYRMSNGHWHMGTVNKQYYQLLVEQMTAIELPLYSAKDLETNCKLFWPY
jgi:hypothetical protein